jgi:NADPH2:quinone reductase
MHVLVSGGAGSVGHYAIQFARLRGATVLATVSSEQKAAHALRAGAAHAILYRDEDVGARGAGAHRRARRRCRDRDGLHRQRRALPGLRARRRHDRRVRHEQLEATLPTSWFMRNRITVKFVFVYEMEAAEREACLRELDALLREGALQHTVALRMPLADIARAHDIVEQGQVVGNVVLDIPQGGN